MGTHPNAILFCVLTPDELARKTFRDIAEAEGVSIEDDNATLKVLGRTITNLKGEEKPQTDFTMSIMEDDYDADGFQISAPAGSIIVHDYVTYGYGDVITWAELQARKEKLEAWAQRICEAHKCSYEIKVTANYW